MSIVYLASFIGGLLLAVLIMIYGVERARADSASGERSFRMSPAVIVAFALVFGLVGYLLTQRQLGTVATRAASAAFLALIFAALTARSVRKWWAVTPEHDVDDERYVLQGILARVTKSIAPGVDGEVAFEVGTERRLLKARGVDATPLSPESEVVIERIEDDIAYVESWSEVEKRL
jgi:membrane protein implicated in regulation of membrane protease activity